MSEAIPLPQNPARKTGTQGHVMRKIALITVLIIGMLIPLGMILGVISERQMRKNEVTADIASTWAEAQNFTGPVLVLPYKHTIMIEDSRGRKIPQHEQDYIYLLPNHYHVSTQLKPETRYRGIFKSVVYTNDIHIEGNFSFDALNTLPIAKESIAWDKAFLTVGLTQPKGLQQMPRLHWQNKPLELLPGTNGSRLVNAGMYTPTPVQAQNTTLPFELSMALRGSEAFSVAPIGKQSKIEMASPWKTPSFSGNTLPNQRHITEKGFTANWEIPYFARSYGQAFIYTDRLEDKLTQSQVTVSLLSPVDTYRQAERATKYGVLFLVLTFSTYFLFELLAKFRIHAFQYLLVGCSLCLFYLLLLALAEILGFSWAYLIASLSTVTTLSLYSKAILGNIRKQAPLIIATLLAILYGYLYILLQLEDLSLLFGTIGLFIVLTAIMFITRHIDWYGEESP